VAKFRVASTPRTFDKATNEWKDGESLFLSCSVWRQAAENVAESLQKGMRVVVQGRLSQRSYEDKQGVKRTVFELEADEVAVSLRNATAQVTKSGGSGQGRQQFQQARHQSSQEGLQDPWTQPAPAGQSGALGGGSGGYSDEPPF
jgi:single-strand DNA-binding protein